MKRRVFAALLIAELRKQVAAWEEERNEAQVEARWQFTAAKARIKLRSLYPSFQ